MRPANISHFLLLLILASTVTLQGCSWGSNGRPAFSGGYSNDGPGKAPKKKHLKDAKPRWEERTRAGNAPSYTVLGKTYRTLSTAQGYQRKGIASWYGRKFHGNKTANGEKYDMYAMTAAHKTLPIPSYVRVRNLNNGKEAIVRINDRGPFVDNREIDLSYAAAYKLGVFQNGTAPVEVTGIEVARNGKILSGKKVAKPEPKPQPSTQGLQAAATSLANMQSGSQAIALPASPATPQAQPLEPSSTTAAPEPPPFVQQWWVQAGAFSNPTGANSLSQKLAAEGFPNVVANTEAAQLAYKVRIGPFTLEEHARWAQESLQRKGLSKGFVVSNSGS